MNPTLYNFAIFATVFAGVVLATALPQINNWFIALYIVLGLAFGDYDAKS